MSQHKHLWKLRKTFFSLFFPSFVSGKWRRTRRVNGIRRHPVSLARRVCHGRGTSNTTPQEMVYRECVCMGDIMGIFFQSCRGETSAEWRRWSHYSRGVHRNILLLLIFLKFLSCGEYSVFVLSLFHCLNVWGVYINRRHQARAPERGVGS